MGHRVVLDNLCGGFEDHLHYRVQLVAGSNIEKIKYYD
jgi:hypothetical protein